MLDRDEQEREDEIERSLRLIEKVSGCGCCSINRSEVDRVMCD